MVMKRIVLVLVSALTIVQGTWADVADSLRNRKVVNAVKEVVREFDRTEDDYIEPPHYEFCVEFRATRNFEDFVLSSNGQSIMFSPDQRVKFGPYFGWRWIFLGTTFNLKNIQLFGNSAKRELDFSIYSSQVGVDLFYRRTGSDYKLRDVKLGYGIDGNEFEAVRVWALPASTPTISSTTGISPIPLPSVPERFRKSVAARGWRVLAIPRTRSTWTSTV